MTVAPSDVDAIRARVSGSSFYTAMRLMPKVEREAMFAVYMFCRLVDDIADDGTRPRPARAAALAEWRKDIDALYAGRPAGQASFLQGPVQAFGLRQADFLAVIDGMEMDVAADIRAPDLATLGLYCDRVAVAVGRLSTRVFGMEEAPGSELAHQLGRALQLTNRSAAFTCRASFCCRRGSRASIPAPSSAMHASIRHAGLWPPRRSIISQRPIACCGPGRAAACWRRD